MHEAQKVLHQNLKEASKEERKEMIAEFKEARQEKHQEIKVQAKAIKEEIREFIETDANSAPRIFNSSNHKISFFTSGAIFGRPAFQFVNVRFI